MLFMHNNTYLPLTGLLTYFVLPEKKLREIFKIFQKYFTKYFMKYFMPKNFMKFYITNCIIVLYFTFGLQSCCRHSYTSRKRSFAVTTPCPEKTAP